MSRAGVALLLTTFGLASGASWPGGLGLAAGLWGGAVAVALALALRAGGAASSLAGTRSGSALRGLLLAWLVGTLASLCVIHPKLAWVMPVWAAAWLWRAPVRAWQGPALLALGLAAAIAGDAHEAAAPASYASVRSGLVLGANPRQSIALEYAPSRVMRFVLDDVVFPRDPNAPDPSTLPPEARPRGMSVPELADRLEASLRAAGERLEEPESGGSVVARQALEGAEVAVVAAATVGPEAELRTGPGLEIRSGLHGPGARLRVVCPGSLLGSAPTPVSRKCPRKYASEANAGLALGAAWPGYSEHPGRARVGFAAFAHRLGLARWLPVGALVSLWAVLWLATGVWVRGSADVHGRARGLQLGWMAAALLVALQVAVLAAGASLESTTAGPRPHAAGLGGYDAWRWPIAGLGLAVVGGRAVAGQRASMPLALGTGAWLLLTAGLGTAWATGAGAAGIPARGAFTVLLQAQSVTLAAWAKLSVGVAEALVGGTWLALLGAAALALAESDAPGAPRIPEEADGAGIASLARWMGVVIGAYLSVRKPGVFDTLMVGALLAATWTRLRGPETPPRGGPGTSEAPEKRLS